MQQPLPAFALAKIQPPKPRTGLVERPTLERCLDSALQEHRLTLLVAPAGYGKTAALTRQIRLLPAGCALAWVSADEDDQLQRFLACLTTALEPHDLPWRVAPDALGTLAQSERGLRDVAYELVNALASAEVERGLVVIDDAHRITDPRVFELLQAVLDRLPEHWGMAMASRVEPPLSLARWRASGDLAEFRQYDLRFSESEVTALVASTGTVLAPEASRELLQRTDGWAAGLRLSLSARQGGAARSPGAPTQRHLFDYLASEVLDDMPPELRWFLLRCSVLPELTAARCAHVSRIPQTPRLLEEVERRGLFAATLDAEELTLRLHDLFRDFLEDRLQRDHPEEVPYLLRRAADNEPDLARAVNYLARAGAWDEAARVLTERGPALVTVGGGPALEQMLALLPEAEFERRADLHLLKGLTTFPRFDFDGMVAAMQRAAAGYLREGRDQEAALAQAYACIGMENTGRLREAAQELQRLRGLELGDDVQAFVCFGAAWAAYADVRADEAASIVSAMLDALERVKDPQVWDRCFFLCIMTGLPGLKAQLERFVAGAARLVDDTPTQLRSGMLHARTWLAFSQGHIEEAAQWLARADEDVRWLGQPRSLMTENWMSHTLIDAVRGDRDASYAAARENKRDLEQNSLPSNRLTHEYEELFTFIRAAWLLGDGTTLRALDAQLQRIGNPYEWAAAADDRRFSRAFIALLDGRLADARELLLPLARDIERSCFFPAMQARVMLADVEQRLGLVDEAAETLRPWLAAAQAGGDVCGAFLAGLPVLQRLAGLAWGHRLTAAAVALLVRLRDTMRTSQVVQDVPVQPLSRPSAVLAPPTTQPRTGVLIALSEREREVLARMAAGDSNKLIARAFDLSPHTVKRHVANILDKLGVATRGQAAARWREHASDS
ncbi:LuxR C-terminal-related transcriptional regulator [Piscinibacter sp. XHJ-5]|uniref:LuxR C-terminal-related transcriptional regulator n=1 Tax=Piscinibacter sp. XHJ-5 TaxID=3037797 RepID=UPI002452B64E|nr:LuxR C-terminal-related transcriptional regulator [Piscinibacter sp. XHJ-5]